LIIAKSDEDSIQDTLVFLELETFLSRISIKVIRVELHYKMALNIGIIEPENNESER